MKQTGYWKLVSRRRWRKSSQFYQMACLYLPCLMTFAHVFLLTENRQSMLFSATQTTKVQDLARMSLRPGPVHIDVDKEESTSTVATLSQGYVVCPSDRRFLLLFTFLKKNLKKKVIVFFSSCNSVKYHGELLNYIDVPVLDLHVSWLHFHNITIYKGT